MTPGIKLHDFWSQFKKKITLKKHPRINIQLWRMIDPQVNFNPIFFLIHLDPDLPRSFLHFVHVGLFVCFYF